MPPAGPRSGEVSRFIDKAKKYDKIDELTPEIPRTFVSRIKVGEREKKRSDTPPRDIESYCRDIGLADDLPRSMAAEEPKQEIA